MSASLEYVGQNSRSVLSTLRKAIGKRKGQLLSSFTLLHVDTQSWTYKD